MRKTQIDKVVEQLQAEIDERQKVITMLVGAQMKVAKKRERKPRIKAVETPKAG